MTPLRLLLEKMNQGHQEFWLVKQAELELLYAPVRRRALPIVNGGSLIARSTRLSWFA